jgi:hypothetical protein
VVRCRRGWEGGEIWKILGLDDLGFLFVEELLGVQCFYRFL